MKKDESFPDVSFCIQLTSNQGIEMFDTLDKHRIPFYYIYEGETTGGAVKVNCKHSEPKVVLEVTDKGKNWIASADYLKSSKDGVFVELITPDNPDDDKPLPTFDDVFKILKVTDRNLEEKITMTEDKEKPDCFGYYDEVEECARCKYSDECFKKGAI